jgi:hypothetical protein
MELSSLTTLGLALSAAGISVSKMSCGVVMLAPEFQTCQVAQKMLE